LCQIQQHRNQNLGLLPNIYGEKAASRAGVLQWHKIFLNCGEDVHDNSKPCTHKTTKTHDSIDKIRKKGVMNDV